MRWSRRRWIAVGAVTAWIALCTVGEIVSEAPALPEGSRAAAALLTAPIPLLGPIARHSWLVVRGDGDGSWQRWDLFDNANGPTGHVVGRAVDAAGAVDDMGNGAAAVEWVIEGAEAARFAACVNREAPRYGARERYQAWPGPNSNSFIDHLLRTCELARPMSATAIGKDWRGIIGVSVARERTGAQLETPLVGASLGLREGIEVHVLALTVGVDLWPPALLLPFGDGRFGFSP